MATTKDLLMEARCRLMIKEPWYGHMAMGIEWREDDFSWDNRGLKKTMAVCLRPGGKVQCLYYKPFVASLTLKQLYGVVQHEIEHLVRLHLVRIGSRNPLGWNLACLPAGELVLTRDGTTKIEELQIQDQIYSSDGQLTRVVIPMSRRYTGKVVSLKARYLLPFTVTTEHPVLVSRWRLRTTNTPHKTTVREYGEPEFVKAGELIGCTGVYSRPARSGFALVLPKLTKTETRKLELTKYIRRPGDGSIRTTELDLNNDMAWFFGLYVAEGSPASDDCCQLTLGSHEREIAEQAVEVLEDYGYNPSITEQGSTLRVFIGSPILGRALADWFGRGAHNKKIPNFLLTHCDPEIVAAFLRGYLCGDGCAATRTGRNFISNAGFSVSKTLALQIQLMAFNQGVPFGLSESNRPEREINGVVLPPERGYQIESGSWQSRQMFGQTWTRQRNYFGETVKHFYLPLLDVTESDYDGRVYNVETTDHTYLVNNAAVHNCDMCVNGTEDSPRIGFRDERQHVLPSDNMIFIPKNWPPNESAEVYYAKMENLVQNTGGFKMNADGSITGLTENDIKGETLDNHLIWQRNEVSEDEARQIVKGMCDNATAKSVGQVPGHLTEILKDLNQPIVRWRGLLRQYYGRHVGNKRFTFSRSNRRNQSFGIKGISRHACASVRIILDTSGSMSTRQLEIAFGEIEQISTHVSIKLLLWDHGYQGYKKYRRGDWKNFQINGRGGTDMEAPVKWLEENREIGDIQIMITDGEVLKWPEPRAYPMIFLVLNGEEKPMPGWGHEVFVRLGAA